MRSPLIAACVLLTGVAATLPAQQRTATFVERDAAPTPHFTDPQRRATLATAFPLIHERIDAAAREIGAPGLSWGVVVDGELAASGGTGWRDVQRKAPVDEDSVFRIASMTKSFTALAILLLRDEGKLSLDAPVTRYIPEFASVTLPTRDAAPITVRNLLTHSAGFPEDNPWGDRQLALPAATLSNWLRRGLPFSTSPATAFEYSNYGFALLGRIVGNVSRTPYRQFVTARILRPLGMSSTYWDPREVPQDRLATGYRRDGDHSVPEEPLGDGTFGAMGGLLTSGRDLGKYVAFMLSAWPPRDEAERGPVRRSSVREMQQGQRLAAFRATRAAPDAPLAAATRAYAYGLGSSQDCRFAFAVAHSGGLPGFGSNMYWLPEYGVGVYAMANVTYAGAGRVVREIVDLLVASGALQRRRLPASGPLTATRDVLAGLVNEWNDARLQAIAADNLFLDRPLAARRDEVHRLRETLGACRPDGEVEAENWLRGTFRLKCEHGWIDTTFTLAPTRPVTVQSLEFVEGRPLSPDLTATVSTLVSLIGAWSEADAARIAGPSLDAAALQHQLAALSADYGSCRLGGTISGDGASHARVRLDCVRGRTDVALRAVDDGRLEQVSFSLPPDETCVP